MPTLIFLIFLCCGIFLTVSLGEAAFSAFAPSWMLLEGPPAAAPLSEAEAAAVRHALEWPKPGPPPEQQPGQVWCCRTNGAGNVECSWSWGCF